MTVRPTSRHLLGITGAALLAFSMTACGSKPPPKKSGDWMDNLKVQNPGAEPDLSGADPDPEPKADPEPEAPKPDTKVKPSTGRPLVNYGPKSQIKSTFGATPGSKLKLTGGVTFVIPEFALDGGYNIDWKIAGSSAPKKGAVVGSIARLQISPGEKLQAKKTKSRGDEFSFLVDTGGAETINLAVGETTTDKNGNEAGKPTWTVMAPTKVNKMVSITDGEEKAEYTAVFELQAVGPVLYVHATTDDP